MYVPSIKLTHWIGPCWTTAFGFILYSISCLQLSRHFHAFFVFACITGIGIAASMIFHGIAIHMHRFKRSRNETFSLSCFTLAESCSVIVPIIMQNMLEMLRTKGFDMHPSFGYKVSLLMLGCGLFSSLYLSNFVPVGASNQRDKDLREKLAVREPVQWSAILLDRATRPYLIPEINQQSSSLSEQNLEHDRTDQQELDCIQDREHEKPNPENMGCEEKEEILPGDLPGSLLYSTDIDEREFNPFYYRTPQPPRDDPLYWRFPLLRKVSRPQFILICSCLSWVQFVVRAYLCFVYSFRCLGYSFPTKCFIII